LHTGDTTVSVLRLPPGLDRRTGTNHPGRVNTLAAILIVLVVVLTCVAVIGVFVWAAVKDGQEDKDLQRRLRIRRRTRLGR
jgi:nitrogen fixation-related uncharacterized protein